MLLIVGGVFFVTAILLLSISTEYWHFMITIGILSGIGTSLIFTPAMAAIGHYFCVRRGLATGIGATGVSYAPYLNNVFNLHVFDFKTDKSI
jgi:ABC-type transporter Mla maintaining outer membrane lipid asymmetry permease subunit MlaE